MVSSCNKIVVLAFLAFSACGRNMDEVSLLTEHQPYVTTTEHAINTDSDTLDINIQLSDAIDPLTVSSQQVFLAPCVEFEEDLLDDWRDIPGNIEDGDLEILSSDPRVNSPQHIFLQASVSDSSSELCLTVLPGVLTETKIPLNQQRGNASTLYYLEKITFQNSVISSEVPSDTDDADIIIDTSTQAQPAEEMREKINLAGLVKITEIVTDPQQDHNDSVAGNGIPFDPWPGTGAVTTSDEYIEIYNGTDHSIDLTGWKLNLQDSSPVQQDFKSSNLELFFSNSGSLADWQSGEIAVIGDPSGSINNEIIVELIADNGEIMDSVTVLDANAVGVEDEAHTLDEYGDWSNTAATPGEINFLDEY